MIQSWLFVFGVVFTALVCLAGVTLGAFLGYCRERQANPIAQLKSIMTPAEESLGKEKRNEQFSGFYE